jgi:hypothetical protein
MAVGPFTILPGDVLEATIFCQLGDQISANVLHYVETTQSGASQTLEQFTIKVSGYFASAYKAVLTNAAYFYGVKGRRVWPVQSIYFSSVIGQGVGTGGIGSLPKQASAIISKFTNTPRQAGRGRVYIPFPPISANDTNGRPSTTFQVQLLPLADLLDDTLTFGAGLDTCTVAPCLWQPLLFGNPRPVTFVQVQPYWGTQRRRGDYGARNGNPF